MPTREDYIVQFQTNLSYESDPTGAMCNLFIAACRGLRVLTPTSSATAMGGLTRFETGFDVSQLAAMENQAQRWQSMNNTGNANALLAAAKVPRQFGLNRLRGEDRPDGCLQNQEVH